MYKWFFAIWILLFSSVSEANSYSRGYKSCGDFAYLKAKASLASYTERIYTKVSYAVCQVLKGGQDENQGLAELYYIIENYNDVYAAYVIAQYIDTGGTFEIVDEDHLDEAIQAYFKARLFINIDPQFPYGYAAYERVMQMDLHSISIIPELYLSKFVKGAIGSRNHALLESSNYEGPKDLKTYDKYIDYTMDSLNKMIENARTCENQTFKRHFFKLRYQANKEVCKLLREVAVELKPMERERLILLEDCKNKLSELTCPQYYSLEDEMGDLAVEASNKLKAIFNVVNEREKELDEEEARIMAR